MQERLEDRPGCDVLIVEDNALLAMYLADICEAHGYRVGGTAATAAQAIELSRRQQPRLVLMDVALAGRRDGLEAAQEIAQLTEVPIIFVTAANDQQTVDRMRAYRAAGILLKPVLPDKLLEAIRPHLS